MIVQKKWIASTPSVTTVVLQLISYQAQKVSYVADETPTFCETSFLKSTSRNFEQLVVLLLAVYLIGAFPLLQCRSCIFQHFVVCKPSFSHCPVYGGTFRSNRTELPFQTSSYQNIKVASRANQRCYSPIPHANTWATRSTRTALWIQQCNIMQVFFF